MPKRSSIHQRDTQELVRHVIDAVAPAVDQPTEAAFELGRLRGKKGGKPRAAKLTAEQRSEIARRAARNRWAK